MVSKREKPVPGHKRARVSYGVTVTCECGKSFGPHYGKGARTQAHSDWRLHVDTCTGPNPGALWAMQQMTGAKDPALTLTLQREVYRRLDALTPEARAATVAEGERRKIWPL